MPLLSSSIVRHQLATVEQVEEALARQSAYGGDLLTNLLEVAMLSEERVARALSESFGLEPAPVGELPRPPEHVRRLVPSDVAERFACHPLEEQAGVLVLAVSEPLPAEVESDLAFALGVTITQRVAPLVRVRQAVSRDYGIALDPRVGRALARLEGRSDPSPSFRPEPEAPIADRPDTVAPGPRPPTAVPAAAPAPPARAPRTAGGLKALVRASRPEPPRARRLGPYTAAMAERDLLDAPTRDEALRAFFDFALQYFEYSALFAVHADLAEGRDAHGPGASRAKVQSIGVPLDLPGVLARARDAQSHELVRLGAGGLDAALAKDLERKPGPLVLLLPIRVRGRTILIVYGDHGESDVDLYAIGDVISFAPHVASALERLIVQKKRGRGEQRALASLAPPPRPRQPLPGPEERAQALVSMLSARPNRPHATFSEPPSPPSDPPPADEPGHDPPLAAEWESLAPPRAEAAPPRADATSVSDTPSRAARPVAPPLGNEEQRSSAPPQSIAEALARPVIQVGTRPSEQPTDPPPGGDASAARRFASVPPSLIDAGWEDLAAGRVPYGQRESGTTPGVGKQKSASSPDDSPDISIGTMTEVESSEFADSDEGVPLAPGSRSAAHSARPLPARASAQDQQLPSVIVDRTADCRMLVDQLIAGDPTAQERLIAAGTPGISALVAAFPGPLEAPSSRRGTGGGARASESGPVLKALARIGSATVPFLVVRTHDADPATRSLATRLLGEIPAPESARAVARRFYDGDIEVRRAALAAARLLGTSPDAMTVLVAELGITAEDRMKPTGVRLTAMEVLADLRHPQGVPYLVLVLEDNPVDLVQAARRSLVILARNDLGATASAWSSWWRANNGRHRIEWLIDALTHESREIRRAAGEELKTLTREYFGYYDDLPAADRQQAQEQYRDWWESRGKARFRP